MSVPAIAVRRATEADARLLFAWVNSPDALAQKEATTRPIAWQDHCDWLARRLASAATFLMIVEADGRPVGQIRLEPKNGEHAVDIYVAPAARRHGLAKAALRRAMTEAGVTRVVARVKAANSASRRLFEAAGFAEAGRDGEMVIYRIQRGAVPNG